MTRSRSRAIILSATAELIEAQGFGAVNVASVARAAQVSRQTIYSAFGGLDALVSEAVATVAVDALAEIQRHLDATTSTVDYLVELTVHGRRQVRTQPVLRALLDGDAGNPFFAPGMVDRGRAVVAGILAPLIERDERLQDPAVAGPILELVTRMGISFVAFDSEAVQENDDLRLLLGTWLRALLDG